MTIIMAFAVLKTQKQTFVTHFTIFLLGNFLQFSFYNVAHSFNQGHHISSYFKKHMPLEWFPRGNTHNIVM